MNAALIRISSEGRHVWHRIFLGALTFGSASNVTFSRDTWLKVSTPEVTVITTVGKGEATSTATEFVQYIAALRGFMGNSSVELAPLTIVLFSRPQDFQRYLPLLTRDGNPQAVGGFFARHEAMAIVGLPARVSEDSRRTIFHEGVHWFLSGTNTRNPLWVEEGLAEVFSTFHAEKGTAEWGRSIDSHLKMLRVVSLPPLEKLVNTVQGELYGNERVRTGVVYAQSWAFVHYLIFGKHDIPRNAILAYLEATSGGMPREQAFQKIFGRNYAEMDQQLRAYLGQAAYQVAKQPISTTVKPTVQPATVAEVEIALGRLALAGKRTAQAMTHAGGALASAPDDPRGHELFALAMLASGDREGALTEFEAAIACGSKDFQPYFEVAAAAHKSAIATGRALPPLEARSIANRYHRAISYYPRFRPAYENLAAVLGVAAPLRQDDRAALELGLRLFPESTGIQRGVAQLARRTGDVAGSRAMLDQVMAARSSLSPEIAAMADRFDAALSNEELSRRVDVLARAGKFGEAMGLIDAKLATTPSEPLKTQLTTVRGQLEAGLLSGQITAALNAERWSEARQLLGRLLESSAPANAKSLARKTLAQLDEQKRGLEPAVAPAPAAR